MVLQNKKQYSLLGNYNCTNPGNIAALSRCARPQIMSISLSVSRQPALTWITAGSFFIDLHRSIPPRSPATVAFHPAPRRQAAEIILR